MEEDKINPDWINKNQTGLGSSQNINANGQSAGQAPIYPAQKKKSGFWGWLIALVILIIIAAAAIIYLNESELFKFKFAPEKYYAKYGIEKLWNGLSVVPDTALTQSSAQMDKINSYKFLENIVFNSLSNQSSNEPNVSLKQLLAFNFNNSLTGEVTLPNSFYFKKIVSSVLTPTEGASDNPQQSVYEGLATDKLYVLSGLETDENNKWLSSTYDSNKNLLVEKLLPSINPLTSFTNLKSNLAGVKYIGTEKINNGSAYHFQGTLKSDYLNLLFNQNDEGFSTALIDSAIDLKKELAGINLNIDFWIAKKTKLIEKITFSANNITLSSLNIPLNISYELNLSDYNSGITYKTIDPAKVDDKATSDFVQIMASNKFSDLMMFSRDKKRKASLQSLKTALDLYKQDNNQFPISAQISKTNDLSSPLIALVPKYLTKLPIDPNDPNNYYGYLSDGNSYILTSILDNRSDPDGVKLGNYYLYKLTN